MAAGTVRISFYGGSTAESTGATAEGSTGKMNRADSWAGTTPIAIPTSTGTGYSWYKPIALDVTSSGTTNIDNRQVNQSSAPAAGLILYFAATSGYVQASSSNMPAATTSGDTNVPSGYTALTTAYQAYSTESSASAAGRNGGFFKLLLGVGSTGTYLGGPGNAIALPTIGVQYDEA